MQQIEYGILLTTGFITSRGIDRQTTCQPCCGALVPHLRDIAVSHFVNLIEICTSVAANEHHAEQIIDVADVVNVQWVDNLYTVNNHVVGIEFGLKRLCGVAPHALVVLHEIDHAWGIELAITFDLDFLCRQQIACNLHFLSLGGNEIECDTVVSIYYGRCNLRALSPTEVLLSLCCHAYETEGSEKNEFFHLFIQLVIQWCKYTTFFNTEVQSDRVFNIFFVSVSLYLRVMSIYQPAF